MDKIKDSQQKRFKILKKALDVSLDGKITKISDLTDSLNTDESHVLSETRHLENIDSLERTIRGGVPTWEISGKAKTAMEKNPKNYDEFLEIFEENTSQSKNVPSDSGNNGQPSGWKWTRKTAGAVSGGIGGIIAIIMIVLLFSSIPNIQISLYETDQTLATHDNSWGMQNMRIVLGDESGGSWSNVCFRLHNAGQEIGTIPIPANNMVVNVKTDAVCKDCEGNTNVGLLKAQEQQDVCEDVKISEGVNEFDFEIAYQYDAIWNTVKKQVYNCEFVETIEHVATNRNDYAYSCSLLSD